MSIEVQGADQLAKLSRALKDMGDKALQRELSKAINSAMRPVKADLQRSASDMLPRRGGLADAVAGSKFRTRRTNSKKAAGIRLVAANKFSLYHIDQGQIRHPRTDGGVTVQHTRPGWWTQPVEAAAPEVRRELIAAMDDISKRIARAT